MYAYTVLLSRPKAAFQNRVRLSEKAYCLGDAMSWASAAAADLCYVLFCCLQWCNPVSVVCHCHDTLTGSESAVCCAGTSPRLNFVSLRDNWLTLAPKGLPVFRSPRIAYHSYFVFCFKRSSDIADNQCNFIRTALLLFVFSTCQSANAKKSAYPNETCLPSSAQKLHIRRPSTLFRMIKSDSKTRYSYQWQRLHDISTKIHWCTL